MRLLLDSHAFLWAVSGDPRLSARAACVMAGRDREVWLSHASVWELTAKGRGGQTRVAGDGRRDGPELWRPPPADRAGHIEATAGLPLHHRDPFDRLLIAQAVEEGLTLVTVDERIRRYPVAWLW
jgi:PIN domain nuclease of toxin-antitoxin system